MPFRLNIGCVLAWAFGPLCRGSPRPRRDRPCDESCSEFEFEALRQRILRQSGKHQLDHWPTIAEASDLWHWLDLSRHGAGGDLRSFLESRRSHPRCHQCGRGAASQDSLPRPSEAILVREGLCSTCQARASLSQSQAKGP